MSSEAVVILPSKRYWGTSSDFGKFQSLIPTNAMSRNEFNKHISTRILELRVEKRLPASRVARYLGLSASHFCNKESGRQRFTGYEVYKLEKIFNAKVFP